VSPHIPFEQIAAAALAQADRLLPEWFPAGRKVGREFKIGNLQGDAGDSLSVNLDTGLWADFATKGTTGHDLIDLYAAMRRVDRIAAARELGAMLGTTGNSATDAGHKKGDKRAWEPMIPPPAGTERPHAMLEGFDVVHEYTDANDQVLFYIGRTEAKGGERKRFTPVTYGRLDGKLGWHHKHPKAPRPLYGLNRLSTMPGATALLCEGEKAADAAQSMFPGCACLTWAGGSRAVDTADFGPLRDHEVIIFPDNDEPGHRAAAEIKRILPHAKVLPVDDLGEGHDAADVFPEDPEAWLNERLNIGSDDAVPNEAAPRAKPVITVISGQIDAIATDAEEVLRKSSLPVFRRGNSLVRPIAKEAQASRGRTVMMGGLQQVQTVGLIDLLAQAASWRKRDGRSKSTVSCNPPKLVADVILSRVGQWGFQPIAGVTTTPTLRPDGTVISEAGYDPGTRLFYIPDSSLRLSRLADKPTRADAAAALALIRGLLREFPFVSPLDHAVALSGIITAVVRGAMPVAPLHAFRAPGAGTGKSYLADVISMIATGRPCPVMSVSANAGEMEKRLTGLLLQGFPLINIDNVNGELQSDLLCQAVERPLLSLRPLGTSEITEIENTATILATGNNLVVCDDLVRRTLLCSLDAGVERPETREFRGNPVAEVQANRGAYVAACLTISRAHLAAGCPHELPPLASFGDWSRLVRSALVWLGCEDPALSIEVARTEDPTLNQMREVFDVWIDSLGEGIRYTVTELVEAANSRVRDDNYGHMSAEYRYPALRTALLAISRGRHELDNDAIGKWLRDKKNRIVGQARLIGEGNGKKPTKWSMRRV
jgi:putative DNA primase/helicase